MGLLHAHVYNTQCTRGLDLLLLLSRRRGLSQCPGFYLVTSRVTELAWYRKYLRNKKPECCSSGLLYPQDKKRVYFSNMHAQTEIHATHAVYNQQLLLYMWNHVCQKMGLGHSGHQWGPKKLYYRLWHKIDTIPVTMPQMTFQEIAEWNS